MTSGRDGQIRISLTTGPVAGLCEPGEQNAIVGGVASRALVGPQPSTVESFMNNIIYIVGAIVIIIAILSFFGLR
jgi:small-conductance mechanosensitive channel